MNRPFIMLGLPHFINLSLAFLLSAQSQTLTAVVSAAEVNIISADVNVKVSTRPSINNAAVDTAVDSLGLAAKNAEALRTRLQDHVAAQVNQLLTDKNVRGGEGSRHTLELKIDLPPDLAALVNNGGALKFHRKDNGELGDLKESTITMSGSATLSVNNNHRRECVSQGQATTTNTCSSSTTTTSDGGYGGGGYSDITTSSSSNTAAICQLGTYSDTGFATSNSKCIPCPEGTTTIRLGSDSCQVVTEEDMLRMFYNLLNGNSWSEQQRQNWNSDLSACEWEGITCTKDGEINELAFPIVGLNNLSV